MSTAIAYRPAAKLQALLDEIEAADGEISPEQERQIEWLLHNEQVEVLDFAKVVKETEALIKTSKEWRSTQKARETRWESMATRMRASITEALVRLRALGESTKLSDPAHSITVSLADNSRGRFEMVGTVQDIPEPFRRIVVTETMDAELVRQEFEAGRPVAGVRWIRESHCRIT